MTVNETPTTPHEAAPWRTAPPRDASSVSELVSRSARAYRRLELMVWGACLLVVALVTVTSSQPLGVLPEALALVTVMFGAPVSVFSALNRSRLRELATHGHLAQATVTSARLVGPRHQTIADVTFSFSSGDGRTHVARASGVAELPDVGAAVPVVVLEQTPLRVALVSADGRLVIARVA